MKMRMWDSLTIYCNDREVHKRTAQIYDLCEHSGEVMEDADALFIVNIENNGENKMLMIKAAKRRDLDPTETDSSIIAIQHPFVSINSFALLDDILENISVSVPIYIGRKSTNFMANI